MPNPVVDLDKIMFQGGVEMAYDVKIKVLNVAFHSPTGQLEV